MEVLEIAAGGGQETGGVILKGGGRSQDDPLLIGDDYLKGEDSEVMAAFSGIYTLTQSSGVFSMRSVIPYKWKFSRDL